MSETDRLVANNQEYAESFGGPLPMPPSAGVAVVACMDARLNVYGILGLDEGEAHVIRNAGGVVTDDEIRSLAISQRLLGTREIILIHHTDCGMLTFTDDAFKASIEKETGIKPPWAAEAFADLDDDVRQSIAADQGQPVRPAHRRGPGLRVRRGHRQAAARSASPHSDGGGLRPMTGALPRRSVSPGSRGPAARPGTARTGRPAPRPSASAPRRWPAGSPGPR